MPIRVLKRVALLRYLAALVATTVALAQPTPSATTQPKVSISMPWVRNVKNNRGVIIFVHGVTGDHRSTWTSQAGFWPDMLTRDSNFDGQNIYVYNYPSPRA